jgi:phosphate starvation-inducible protein PhoH
MSKKNKKNPNKSIHSHVDSQTSLYREELIIKERFKYNEKQQEILERGLHKDTRCLILNGCAGTSKTYLSLLIALKLLNQKKIKNINYIRSLIQSQDGETGFLSGNLQEKTLYFNIPLYDKLEELLTTPDINHLIKQEIIRTYPTSMLRGIQLGGVTIIDESQNMLFSSIETILTRMQEHSLLIILGDASGSQNDLGSKTGFKKTCDIFNDKESQDNGIHYFQLDSSHIVRSKLVKFVIEKIEKLKK